jgi:hypothetical protein
VLPGGERVEERGVEKLAIVLVKMLWITLPKNFLEKDLRSQMTAHIFAVR